MCCFAKPNVKSNCNICNGHGSRGESTPFIKTAHKNEMYSFCRFINKWRCRAIQRFTHTFPWFHWIPSHLLTAFCELCLFQVRWWLTHSSRVITSRMTRRCLVDYTVNETCSRGGHFREIPLKRGYPRCRGNPLCPLPLIVLATPKPNSPSAHVKSITFFLQLSTPLLTLLPCVIFHATPLWHVWF